MRLCRSLATLGIDPVNRKDPFVSDDYDEFPGCVVELLRGSRLRKRITPHGTRLEGSSDHIHAAGELGRVLLEK